MMDKSVAQKIDRIKNGIADDTDVIRDLLELALTSLPYSYHEHDNSWAWCWEELSNDAQEYVLEVHSLISLYLKWKKETNNE
ncbi:hypothetical protein LCGC14_1215320 [marine sediment metagenome]|uniref:Uncharacterized protein n=1 Tax=marine sediment metagenome TaxID=412755 RepID=A0A0F9NV92_9ZZZZ